MKKTVSLFVLVSYFFLITHALFPYFSYLINYNYIAEILCINNDKPELKCNGKCYLNKQISRDDEKESKQSSEHSSRNEKLPVIISTSILISPEPECNISKSFPVNIFCISKIPVKPETPPPKC